MRLGRALDSVLLLVALGGKQADHLIDAVTIAATEQARDDVNIVPNAKLVRHKNLRTVEIRLSGTPPSLKGTQ